MKEGILAIDQGTTGSTALVFSRQGEILGRAYAEITNHFPEPGWVEQDPEEIWDTSRRVMVQALRASGVGTEGLKAIGITNQRETTVLWDRKTGEPVHRAVVWQSRQNAPLCERLRAEGLEPEIRRRTGLLLDAYFSGTKIAWILDQVPGARRMAEEGRLAFGTIDTWLIWNLTGGARHVTDCSNASRTMLYNIHRGDWDEELLEILRIPRAILPQVRASSRSEERRVGKECRSRWSPYH